MSALYNQEVMDVIATLEQEIRQVRARNERLENEYSELERRYDTLKEQCDIYKRQIGVDSGRAPCYKNCD